MYHGVLSFSASIDASNVAIRNFQLDRGGCRCFVDVYDSLIKITVEVSVSCENDFSNAFENCYSLSVDMANRISFFVSSKIGDIEYRGGRFVKDDGRIVEYPGKIIKKATVRCSWNIGVFLDTPEFKDIMLDSSNANEFHYKAYKRCMDVDDVVSKFMFLYNILLCLVGDSGQRNVDDLIKSIDETVAESLSPRNRMETIYTRLRNEVAHNRGVEFVSTDEEISHNINAFQCIVNKAIMVKVASCRTTP